MIELFRIQPCPEWAPNAPEASYAVAPLATLPAAREWQPGVEDRGYPRLDIRGPHWHVIQI